MIRHGIVAAVAVLAVACAGAPTVTPLIIYVTQPPASPVSGTSLPPQASQAAVPTATPGAGTTRPTSRPPATPQTTRTPLATSNATKDDPVLRTWSSSGYVTAQVITRVTNTGGTWIELLQFDSIYTIYDQSGGIVATNDYVSAVGPRYLGPGDVGYAVAEEFGDEYQAADYDYAEMDVYFGDASPGGNLTVENTKVRRSSLDGVEVTGELVNDGTIRVDSASVLAVFIGSNGEPLGYASGSAENVEPGGRRAFQISSSFAEIPLDEIADTLVFASDDSF